jgi:hypothetical protein
MRVTERQRAGQEERRTRRRKAMQLPRLRLWRELEDGVDDVFVLLQRLDRLGSAALRLAHDSGDLVRVEAGLVRCVAARVLLLLRHLRGSARGIEHAELSQSSSRGSRQVSSSGSSGGEQFRS